ncbi:BPSS1780 family membrane protein [Rhodoferax sp. WC2427]|uniref:BPSS1780 family membrane protein n=1 Tax=Rhodoferax sp. WC2427 TaxID=3234144 RepID=UPI00346694BE
MKLQIVPARTGALWVRLGIQTFFQQPLALAGLFFMCMAALSIVSLVPILGSIAAMVFLPTMALALMAATQEASKGKFPTPNIVLGALRAGQQGMRPMLVLGALYAAGFLVVLGISALVDGGEFARVFLGNRGAEDTGDEPLRLQAGMLAFMVLHLPLSLAFWHAPALVHWHGISPGKSLFFSLVACWRNKGAYVLFGLSWFGVLLVVGMVVQLLAALLDQPAFLGVGAFVVTLLTTCMFLTSIYFSFRDSFSADDAEVKAPDAIE